MFRARLNHRFLAIQVISLLVAVSLPAPGPAQQEQESKFALLVGVTKYKHDKLRDLEYTENDVEELAKVLPGFKKVLLTSKRGVEDAKKAPTTANIRRELKLILD